VVVIELVAEDGSAVHGLADPSGGTFDAAGDFQRFVDETSLLEAEDLPRLRSLDAYAAAQELLPTDMPDLITDIEACLVVAKPGSEMRGLLRLRVLADLCATNPASRLRSCGD